MTDRHESIRETHSNPLNPLSQPQHQPHTALDDLAESNQSHHHPYVGGLDLLDGLDGLDGGGVEDMIHLLPLQGNFDWMDNFLNVPQT